MSISEVKKSKINSQEKNQPGSGTQLEKSGKKSLKAPVKADELEKLSPASNKLPLTDDIAAIRSRPLTANQILKLDSRSAELLEVRKAFFRRREAFGERAAYEETLQPLIRGLQRVVPTDYLQSRMVLDAYDSILDCVFNFGSSTQLRTVWIDPKTKQECGMFSALVKIAKGEPPKTGEQCLKISFEQLINPRKQGSLGFISLLLNASNRVQPLEVVALHKSPGLTMRKAALYTNRDQALIESALRTAFYSLSLTYSESELHAAFNYCKGGPISGEARHKQEYLAMQVGSLYIMADAFVPLYGEELRVKYLSKK